MGHSDAYRRDLEAYQDLRPLWRGDPEQYVHDRFGVYPSHQQRRILQAIAEPGAKVSVRSGHNTGKTTSAAWCIWWFLECHDYSRVPCTAPTASTLRDGLWAELAKWFRLADERSRTLGTHRRFWLSSLFGYSTQRVADHAAPAEWFAVARTSGRDNPDALQGFHASDIELDPSGESVVRQGEGGSILFVVDEAAGVFERVFEVAEGALASEGSRLLMLANPTKIKGYFANSHGRSRSEFRTIHLRSQDSPFCPAGYRERLVRLWGEGSNIVRVRADGEFPRQEDDVLIALEIAEAPIYRPAYQELGEFRVGVDVARFGSDRTVFSVRRGRNLVHVEVHAQEDTMVTTGRAIALADKYRNAALYVDVGGMGAGVVDRLREQGRKVVAVDFGSKAPAYAVEEGLDARPRLMRDHLWLRAKMWLQHEEPSFEGVERDIAEELAGELSAVKYRPDSSGRFCMETKDETKKPDRLGRSPDLADSLITTFADAQEEILFGVAA